MLMELRWNDTWRWKTEILEEKLGPLPFRLTIPHELKGRATKKTCLSQLSHVICLDFIGDYNFTLTCAYCYSVPF